MARLFGLLKTGMAENAAAISEALQTACATNPELFTGSAQFNPGRLEVAGVESGGPAPRLNEG